LTRARRIADWLMLGGGVVLFTSLFLTWSHQVPAVLAGSPAVQGVPRDPTAWQVYALADVLLALLALVLVVLALRGRSRWARVVALSAVCVALAFVAHAASRAPTNGVLVTDPADPGAYLHVGATPGAGETVALVGLGVAAAGLVVSLPTVR
jgi:hypothetical protein